MVDRVVPSVTSDTADPVNDRQHALNHHVDHEDADQEHVEPGGLAACPPVPSPRRHRSPGDSRASHASTSPVGQRAHRLQPMFRGRRLSTGSACRLTVGWTSTRTQGRFRRTTTHLSSGDASEEMTRYRSRRAHSPCRDGHRRSEARRARRPERAVHGALDRVAGEVAQSVEHAAENRGVGGSIPPLPTDLTSASARPRVMTAAFDAVPSERRTRSRWCRACHRISSNSQ